MRILIILFVLSTTACATIHDYCTSHSENYSSYNECYQERSERKQRIANAWGDAFSSKARTTVTCQTYGNTTYCN